MHFSVLAGGGDAGGGGARFGRIDKGRCGGDDPAVASSHPRARSYEDADGREMVPPSGARQTRKAGKSLDPIDPDVLRRLPVVVCVAMFRTNGALESNVASIGRIEGEDLWHVI